MPSRADPAFRYLLAFRPEAALRDFLVSLQAVAGQGARRVKPGNLHLTLATIAESGSRDRALTPRLKAVLPKADFSSCPIRLGRVAARGRGAEVVTIGRKTELMTFYGRLAVRLQAGGFAPLHRKWGLRPHITLGYDPCDFAPFALAHHWVPHEMVLIESEVGHGIHTVLHRWPLAPPSQGMLPLDMLPALKTG